MIDRVASMAKLMGFAADAEVEADREEERGDLAAARGAARCAGDWYDRAAFHAEHISRKQTAELYRLSERAFQRGLAVGAAARAERRAVHFEAALERVLLEGAA